MDIKYFERVIGTVECGSINKAVQNLQMLQPNLSVCIKNLEQEPGFPILCRQHSGIYLTNEGELFLKSARRIVTESETTRNIPSMFSHRGNLSISCTYSFDFTNHFPKFKKKKSPIVCEDPFKETGLIQTIRDVVEQRYRMSLFYCLDTVNDIHYAPTKKYSPESIPIACNRPLILLASKEDSLSHKKKIPFDSIIDYKFVIYENLKFDE